MAIQNEELMQKLVRTGMIMRHIDGEGPCPHKREHGHGCHSDHGHEHGHHHGEAAPEESKRCGHGHKHGHGKRHGQARVLMMISMQEGINQKDLAFLMGIRPQTLGEMLAKLEERGMVERRKSEADGRAIEVTLTDEGRTRAAEIAERRKVAAADMFAALTDEEKDQLATILDKLDAELDKHRPKRCRGRHEDEKAEGAEE